MYFFLSYYFFHFTYEAKTNSSFAELSPRTIEFEKRYSKKHHVHFYTCVWAAENKTRSRSKDGTTAAKVLRQLNELISKAL